MTAERAQALALVGLNKLPAQFIRPAHERPENTVAVVGVTVPVISLSQPHDVVVREVAEACQEWGFFLLTDHGISPSLIQRLKEVGQEFYELPQEEKEAHANDAASGKFEGYGTKMTKNLEEKVEWIDYYFHLMAPASKVNYDAWPKNPPAYRVNLSKIDTCPISPYSKSLGVVVKAKECGSVRFRALNSRGTLGLPRTELSSVEPNPSHKRHVPIKLIMARSGQGWRRLKINLTLLSVKIRSRGLSRPTFGVTESRTPTISTNRSPMSIPSMAPVCWESGSRQGLSALTSPSLPSLVLSSVSLS
uniref:Non-haem dioxygenase N-terminal domain-containing protein n=1 Tax=Quercus lobata TaxID=97700 RepID=A0A7N2LRP7_QUELO